MKSRDFCYWLQGFFEIAPVNDRKDLNERQVNLIQQHLALVFKHEIDPAMGDKKHQEELTNIHGDKIVLGGITENGMIARC